MPVALVTGATSGIGLAYARRLAQLGHDVVLVARDEARLQVVADELSGATGRKAEVLAADLTDRTALRRVEERLRDSERPVDLLVNNAGFALRKPFLANEVDDEERMLDIHVRAVLRLTHAAVRGMVQRGHGAVVNVSSVATWFPRGSYSAHKAWVTSFTEGLSGSLRGTGVAVQAVCPGFVRSEFHQRAGLRMDGFPRWAWLTPDEVVEASLADLRRGRVVSVPSRRYRLAAGVLRHAPRSLLVATGRRYAARTGREPGDRGAGAAAP